MSTYCFFLASALEKVFPDQAPAAMAPGARLSTFRGQRANVQLVYHVARDADFMPQDCFDIEVSGAPCPYRLRRVDLVPSDYPCYEGTDDNYLSKNPGLFPDLLSPMAEARVIPLPRQYRSIMISFDVPADAAPGVYEVAVTARHEDSGQSFTNSFVLCISGLDLSGQRLLHTQWFHADCLANYYGCEPLSEPFWQVVERFIAAAAREHHVNMLLTPIFTPPLDTAVGGERRTVQLVRVFRTQGKYRFDFEQLRRWGTICRRHGITHLEIAHLFTQWGAEFTPKIMAEVDGSYQRIFGWDVPATSSAYAEFLAALLPALQAELLSLGYDRQHVIYHISDEPHERHLESYRAAKQVVADLLSGCQVMDALSSFEFYRHGLVPRPIPSNDHIQPFIDAKVTNLWVYYCCAQGKLVPNRFYSMPSARNRIMGVLMYLYKIEGLLHWGYNFYNFRNSVAPLNPYIVTHAGYAFPSGDAYLVYPGEQGEALSSLRAEVQHDAFVDFMALTTLEQHTSREHVEALIYKHAPMQKMTFTDYPKDADYLLRLREAVASELEP